MHIIKFVEHLTSFLFNIYNPPRQTYLTCKNSSTPKCDPSRPRPDSFTPPGTTKINTINLNPSLLEERV